MEKIENRSILVLWDLYDTKIHPKEFKDHMAKLCFEKELIDAVPDFCENKVVKASAKKWRKGRGDNSYEGVVISDGGGVMTVGVLERQRVSNSEVRKIQVDSFEWLTNTKDWASYPATNEGIQLRQFIERQLKGYSSAEITKYVIMPTLQKLCAFPMRKKGGMYMMPIGKETITNLKMVRDFAAWFNGSNEFHIYHVDMTEESKKSASSSIANQFKQQLKKAKEQIEGWRSCSRKIRSDAKDNIFGKLEKMSSNLQLYKDALSLDLKDVEYVIKQAKELADKTVEEMDKKFDSGEKQNAVDLSNYEEIFEYKDGELQGEYRMRVTMALLGTDKSTQVELFTKFNIDHEGNELWDNIKSLVEIASEQNSEQ